ncbi:MAG: hypothetical protein ACQEXJ_01130 [Myxococcota bacterium]
MHAPDTRTTLTHPMDLRAPTSPTRRTLRDVTGRLAAWLLVRVVGVDRVLGV